MKKYFSYFFVMILSCTVLFTTSCSDDDDHPYQKVIDDSDSRLTFDDIDVDLDSESWVFINSDNGIRVSYDADDAKVNIFYTGDLKTGVKQDPVVEIWDGDKWITYPSKEISKLEVVKVEEPKSYDEPGKIWVVAVIDGEEFVFVSDYQIEGGQNQ